MKPFDPRLLRLLPGTRKEVAAVAFPVVLQGVVAVLQALAVAWLATAVTASVYATLTGRPTPPAGLPDDPDPTLGQLGPFVVPSSLSTGSDAGSVTSLLAPALAVTALLTVRGLLAGWVHYRSAVAGARVAGELREALAARWLAGGPGRSSTQLTAGVDQVEPYVANFLPSLVAAGAVPVMVWLALAWVDLFSAVVVLLTLPLLPVFAALIGSSTADETARRWRALDALAGHFLDVMRGLPTLVNLGRAEKQVRTIEEVGQRHRRATVTTLRTAFLTTAAMELLSTISVAIVAVFVGLRLAHGDIGLMVGLAAILLAPEAYWPVRRVGADFHAAADGVETLDAVLPLLEEPVRPRHPGVQGTADAQAPADAPVPEDAPARHSGHLPQDGDTPVRTGEVSLTHADGPTIALAQGWSLPAAGLVAVTGPSGAGKSTLLWLLAGLVEPTRGQVVAPHSHLVTQRPYLPRGGVEAALRITPAAARATDAELHAAVERVGLLPTIEQLPQGWETDLGDDGQGLSAGERARLGLARALLDDAPVLLLDEPTAHLDADTAELVHRVLLEESARRLVVVATHRGELTHLATWQVEVAAGRVALPVRGAGAGAAQTLPEPVAALEATLPVATAPEGAAHGGGRTAPEPVPERAPEQVPGRDGERTPVVTPTPKLWRAALVGALSSLAGVALTATSGWLIVRAWEQPVVLMLMVAIVGVRTFGLARPVLRYAERLDSHDVALDQLARRRAETYRRLVPLTPARLGRRGRARVLTGVVADLDDVVMAAVRWWVPLVGALLTGLVAAALLAVLSPLIGLLVALQTLLVVGGSALVERRTAGAQQQELAARGRVWEAAHTAADRCDELRAVNAGATALQAVVAADQDVVRWVRRRAAGQAAVRAASWLLAGVVVAVAAVLAPSAGWGGPLVALLVLTPLALADVLGGVPDAVSAHSRARAATERLEALLGQEPAVAQAGDPTQAEDSAQAEADAPVSAHPHLELADLTARWSAQAAPTVAGLDLDLAPGDRVALTGPSGAGKSTVLAVLARHLDPSGGDYTLDGVDVLDLPLAVTRGTVAFQDDSPHVFSSTLRENLRTARPTATDAELEAVLADAGLGDFLDSLPDRLDTMLGAGHRTVSGGEQARIGLARTLLSERPMVLLDEPVAHLDGPTARAVMQHLGTATAGRSVVLVSHRTEGHEWCGAEVRLESLVDARR